MKGNIMGVVSSSCNEYTLKKVFFEKRRISNFLQLVENMDPAFYEEIQNFTILGYEKICEWSIAHLSNNIWVDAEGMDLSNKIDVKTVTIRKNKRQGDFSVRIGNLNSKIGDLVVLVYDPDSEEYRYFYFPYKIWKRNYNPNGSRGYISMSFPRYQQSISWWVEYEVESFKDLINLASKNGK